MIKFLDGPAAGVVLDLKRAPHYLRVVRSCRGNWDALDQLTDQPKFTETILVYKLYAWRGVYHLKCTRRSGSGFRPMADYKLHAVQPADEVLRDTTSWQEWAMGQPAAAPLRSGEELGST